MKIIADEVRVAVILLCLLRRSIYSQCMIITYLSCWGKCEPGKSVMDCRFLDHTSKGINKQGVVMLDEQLDKQTEMQKRIETYLLEGLPPDEEDALWVEFLKDPHWYSIFETELHFTHLAKNAEKDFESYFQGVG